MSVVLQYLLDNPLFRPKQLHNAFLLSVTKFEHEFSLRLEQSSCSGSQVSVKLQTVGTAIQSEMRIKLADFRLKHGDFMGRYVGRIGNNQIEGHACRHS